MKIFKISMLAIVLAGVLTMGSAFTVKMLTTTTYNFGPEFQMLTDDSSPIADPLNWSSGGSTASCEDEEFLCAAVVEVTSGSPTPAQIFAAIRAKYETLNANDFTHGQQFSLGISGVTATATVYLKEED